MSRLFDQNQNDSWLDFNIYQTPAISVFFDRGIIAVEEARVANQVSPEEQRTRPSLQNLWPIITNPVISSHLKFKCQLSLAYIFINLTDVSLLFRLHVFQFLVNSIEKLYIQNRSHRNFNFKVRSMWKVEVFWPHLFFDLLDLTNIFCPLYFIIVDWW